MKTLIFLILLAFFVSSTAFAPGRVKAAEVDWNSVPSSKLILFYPGVTSWEFLTSDDHRLGGRDIKRRRKDCRHCHLSKEGELDLKANEIVAGTIKMKRSHNSFEPEPEPGKKGVIRADIQAVYDDEYLYVRLKWSSRGAAWGVDADSDTEPDRVSMQVNASNKIFRKYGCFITCHNDLNSMPGTPSSGAVSSDLYYKRLKRSDVRLYAFYAREGWKKPKPSEDITGLIRDGSLIDLLSVELKGGKATARDGWILEDRRWEDADALAAEGSWMNGFYSVVFKRKMALKGERDVGIKKGDVVFAGVSIHDEGSKKRKHYVSFPFSIGLGVDGDVKAGKVSQ